MIWGRKVDFFVPDHTIGKKIEIINPYSLCIKTPITDFIWYTHSLMPPTEFQFLVRKKNLEREATVLTT